MAENGAKASSPAPSEQPGDRRPPSPGARVDDTGGHSSQDDDLSARIEAARKVLEPETGPSAADKYNALTLAWRMTLELVVGTAVGFGIGWGLDSLLGTKPLFMLVFGLFGFAAGIKLVYETAQDASKDKSARASEGEAPGEAGAKRDAAER